MTKYVAYTPSENEYSSQADIAFIKKRAINGDIAKVYKGANNLRTALNYSERNGYTLIVATLNHLGNNPKEIISIYERLGADRLICCDCRVLTLDTIPLLFEHGRMLSEWRKTLIQEVPKIRKKKGQKLGNPDWEKYLTYDAQKKGAAANKQRSQNDPANQAVLPEIKRLRELGYSLQKIANELNKRKFRTVEGKLWTATGVQRVYERNLSFEDN